MNDAWDNEKAADLVGADIIIGITYCDPTGKPEEQVQAYGVILSANKENGIEIKCSGTQWNGETIMFPPDLASIQPAPPGEYRFRSTGEIFTDPDFQTSWTITKPKN